MRAPLGNNRGEEPLSSTAPPRLEGAKRLRAHTVEGPQPPEATPKDRITRGATKRRRAGKAGKAGEAGEAGEAAQDN